MSKDAIELLEKARDEGVKHTAVGYIDHALAILKQPKDQLKTCNCVKSLHLGGAVLCPDCQQTNSEFIEGARALLRQGANDEQWEFATLLRKACDRLEASEQKPKDQQPSSEKDYSNSEFIKVQRAAAQAAIDAYEEDQEWCPTKTARLLEACDRLEVAIAKDKTG